MPLAPELANGSSLDADLQAPSESPSHVRRRKRAGTGRVYTAQRFWSGASQARSAAATAHLPINCSPAHQSDEAKSDGEYDCDGDHADPNACLEDAFDGRTARNHEGERDQR
jgi:hypothetical protein